jgi:uncharacterized protein (TIGR02246 family)
MTKAQAQSAPSSAQDIAAIEAVVSAQADAWNQGNAKGFAVRFAEDGSFTNIIGMTFYGREAFEQRHAEIFRTIYKGSSVRQRLSWVRLLGFRCDHDSATRQRHSKL